MEHGHLLRVAGHGLKAAQTRDAPGLAGLDRPIELGERAPQPLSPVQGHAANRSGRFTAKELARLGQLEPVAGQVAHEVEAGQRPHQSQEGAGMRGGLGRQVVRAARPLGQEVEHLEPHGHVDHLGAPAPCD